MQITACNLDRLRRSTLFEQVGEMKGRLNKGFPFFFVHDNTWFSPISKHGPLWRNCRHSNAVSLYITWPVGYITKRSLDVGTHPCKVERNGLER